MTGGNFPVETELVYSSDSDNGEVTSTTKNNVSKAKETVTETSQTTEVVNTTAAIPAVPQQIQYDYLESSDDEFGANDSRSEYTAVKNASHEEICEEISSESPREEIIPESPYKEE